MNKTIYFYYEDEPNGYFSNFYESPFVLNGKEWDTVEHYYQAQKSKDPEYAELIRQASTAEEAKRLGNIPECSCIENWNNVKVDVMREAVRAKYTQIWLMRERLIRTGDCVLVENSLKDTFWGIGPKGTGKSMLGKILMQLRKEIKCGKYDR